jgi:hypothetical protein
MPYVTTTVHNPNAVRSFVRTSRTITTPEIVEALRGARLMLYAWKGARAKYGDHPELERTIAEVEAAIELIRK